MGDALVLERDALQLQVAGSSGGGQRLAVAGVGLGVALLLDQDVGDLSQASSRLAVVSQFAVDVSPRSAASSAASKRPRARWALARSPKAADRLPRRPNCSYPAIAFSNGSRARSDRPALW
jgi:hypothetical protein